MTGGRRTERTEVVLRRRRRRLRLGPTGAALGAIVAVVAGALVAPGRATAGRTSTDPAGVTVGASRGAVAGAVSAATQARTRPGDVGARHPHAARVTQVPGGFASQVDAVYGGLLQTIAALDRQDPGQLSSAGQLPSAATFAADLAGLKPAELSSLYQAAKGQSRWSAVVAGVRAMAAAATSSAGANGSAGAAGSAGAGSTGVTGLAGVAGAGVSAGGAGGAGGAAHVAHALSASGVSAGAFPPPEPAGSFPSPPSPFVPSSPVGAYTPTACPPGAPGGPSVAPGDSAIFAAQLTGDVAANVAQDVPGTITVIIAGEGTSIPDPAKYIAEAIQLAAVITLDTFNYVQAVANDCDTANRDGFLANIDNTTVNVYDLLSAVQATLDNVESSINTIHARLGVLQQTMDAQITLAIEQALTAPMSSIPNLAFELPASVGGNLDSTPVGVQAIAHQAVQEQLSAGAPVNAAAQQFLAMGDAAVLAGDDKAAYTDFHQAYLQAVGR